jgi:hypothetical protein
MYLDGGIDGNPFRVMGVIGHPNNIHDIRVSSHTDYIITVGGNTINGWKYRINPLIENYNKGGEKLQPFMTMIDGGGQGVVFQDMNNLFYYAQIKSKDENTTKVYFFKPSIVH